MSELSRYLSFWSNYAKKTLVMLKYIHNEGRKTTYCVQRRFVQRGKEFLEKTEKLTT